MYQGAARTMRWRLTAPIASSSLSYFVRALTSTNTVHPEAADDEVDLADRVYPPADHPVELAHEVERGERFAAMAEALGQEFGLLCGFDGEGCCIDVLALERRRPRSTSSTAARSDWRSSAPPAPPASRPVDLAFRRAADD